jgi:hypothetical protein
MSDDVAEEFLAVEVPVVAHPYEGDSLPVGAVGSIIEIDTTNTIALTLQNRHSVTYGGKAVGNVGGVSASHITEGEITERRVTWRRDTGDFIVNAGRVTLDVKTAEKNCGIVIGGKVIAFDIQSTIQSEIVEKFGLVLGVDPTRWGAAASTRAEVSKTGDYDIVVTQIAGERCARIPVDVEFIERPQNRFGGSIALPIHRIDEPQVVIVPPDEDLEC